MWCVYCSVRIEKLLKVIADMQQPGSELSQLLSHSCLLSEDSQLAPHTNSNSPSSSDDPYTLINIKCVCVCARVGVSD